MALEDYNSLLIERLESLIAGVDDKSVDAASKLLDALADSGFPVVELVVPRNALDDGDLDAVGAWAQECLDEMRGDHNPFAGEEESDIEFDLEGAFLDLEDSGFREPSDIDATDLLSGMDLESSAALELIDPLEESDPSSADEAIDDEASAGSLAEESSQVAADSDRNKSSDAADADFEKKSARHVLSGKFKLASPDALSRKAESFGDSLDQAQMPPDEEGGGDEIRRTRPNVTPDFGPAKRGSWEQDRPFDSGSSGARYAATEPPPPTHRLKATEISSGESSDEPELLEDSFEFGFQTPAHDATPFKAAHEDPEEEEFDFDLGFENPEAARSGPAPSAASEPSEVLTTEAPSKEELEDDDGFDFDLGFENPETKRISSSTESGEAVVEDEDDGFDFDLGFENPENGPQSEAERDRELTPMAGVPAADPEDMFFEMAEALAADSSDVDIYRGEPLVPSGAGKTNQFAHDAPTGTAHPVLEAARSAVIGADESYVATNLSAILLEARRLRASGELGAALDITKKILSRGDDEDAAELRSDIEEELEKEHLERLGSLQQTPILKLDMSKLSELDLDHRAGFIISQVDGVSTYEDLIELSGMGRLETLSVFVELLEQGVIVADQD